MTLVVGQDLAADVVTDLVVDVVPLSAPDPLPWAEATVPWIATSEANGSYVGKRLLDVILALAILLLLLPAMMFIAVGIWATDGAPIFYRHTRVGRGGRSFSCLKFRTMAKDADARLHQLLAADPVARAEYEATQKLRSDPRVTRFGQFLRRTSLDELPQLFNVVAGHMSLVGPRPITSGELDRYQDRVDCYLVARPGLTGLWQVNGRSTTTYDERVALDVSYVSTMRLRRDLMLLLCTVPAVLRRAGAY